LTGLISSLPVISPRRELLLAFLALALLGAALFGPQVAHGGFYWDDWQNSANVHSAGDPGLFASLDRATQRPVFGYRPVLTSLLVVEHWALGQDKHLHLALAVLFGVLTAWALYVLLRTVGLGRFDSFVPSALLLAFPWVDSTRMWVTASYDTLAVALYLLGAALAVRGLRAPPGRGRWLLTAASLVLYLLASWTYEVVTAAVVASVAIYLCVAPRRAALKRFALDAGAVAIALAVNLTGTTRVPRPFSEQIDHAGTLASQAFSLLARALVPIGYVPGWVGAAALALVAGGGALAWRRLPADDARRPWLRRWLAAAGIGALGVAAGYTLFVPAQAYYQPLAAGTVTRMNVLASAGYAVVVYALVRLVTGRRTPLAAALCVAIGAGYVVMVAHDQEGWQRSATIQRQVLAAVHTSVPHPAPHTTIYTFRAPTFAARNVPAFSLPFDLKSAVRLSYRDPSLAAYPIPSHGGIVCDPQLLYPTGGTYGRVHGAVYGTAVFVDVAHARAIPIRDRAACLRGRSQLGARPG
jgi:hypothetical protein